ncbi:unnamed protein product [Amaranthus hypochondriacus]
MEIKEKMKDLDLHGGDLDENKHIISMKNEEEIWFENNQITNNNNDDHDDHDDILDVTDPSLFYADFPSLPDFPCMSSSSSSSSTPPVAVKPIGVSSTATTSSSASTASSGAASWALLKSDAEHNPSLDHHHQHHQPNDGHGMDEMLLDDVDQCMDMMQNFGCIDNMLENSDICWDPSPLFEENGDEDERVFQQFMQQQGDNDSITNNSNISGIVDGVGQSSHMNCGGVNGQSEDLAMVFFEWLKTNKEAISAEDLRNIKIKKSTIENAAKRLGGGKEGMKELLKLILQWVQNHHLQNKRIMAAAAGSMGEDDVQVMGSSNNNSMLENINNIDNNNNNNLSVSNNDNSSGNGNPSCGIDPCFSPSNTWVVPTPPSQRSFVSDTTTMVPLPCTPTPGGYLPSVGYMGGGDPYSGGNPMAAYPSPMVPQPSDYHTWAPTPIQYGIGLHYGSFPDAAQFGGYTNTPPYPGFYYHPGAGEGLMRMGSSATKEARKKRMARQRRFFTHHHRSSHHHQHHLHQNNQNGNSNGGGVNQHMMINPMVEQHAGVGNGTMGFPHGSWVYWPPNPSPQMPPPPPMNHMTGPMVGQMMPPQPPLDRVAGNGLQKQVGIEKKQGWKTEKNLRFLLQKVLKQSDVGNLGRIVLPKKEAETHLPELEARDGIPIAMEDIGTSRVWNMRYRFWPNNKSRMYLLENTGDFVRSNGLQEGDFIVIYSDVKCGKYMIRGVKVRPQQQTTRPETSNKKANKTQKMDGTSSPARNGAMQS